MQIGTLSLPEICPHNDHNTDPSKMDTVHFWACARKCTNAGGNTPFERLTDFTLRVLTLPISNADIERVFSVLAVLKTKQRNRLQLASLQSVLRVRCHLRVSCLRCFFNIIASICIEAPRLRDIITRS